ncbi:Transcription factor [Akanthomyces lecanii RCEF 1005]|uniref:Transcription factor n=1 Tax=Akanthomyces lecanii RCEF 1005 TaxID=1081108 RepID=A0A162LSP5_CORDF|nr:Transcription factor [Akanthomyces lecanii RCEF 1005]
MAPPRKSRSRVACQHCHARKVKCDVAETEIPCSNCRQNHNGAMCVVLPRKKHRPRRKRDASGELAELPSVATPIDGSRSATGMSLAVEPHSVDSNGHETLEDATFDPSLPDAPQRARIAAPTKPPARKAYEVEYMRHQGVFKQLPEDVCEILLRQYFEHVHFFLPVLDASTLLTYTENPSLQFVNDGLLRRAGFLSRKEMKTAMYERAKCLYDLDQGSDKLTLIRAVTLLAFWYSDPQDHTGAWYWIGIAISLAQAINLHRASGPGTRNQKSSPSSESVARRIWWSLVVRDRWIAVAKGRPMRIRNDSHDLLMPTHEDVHSELHQLKEQTFTNFISNDSSSMTEMWLRMVRISDGLGDVLQLHYRIKGPEPSMEEVDQLSHHLDELKLRDKLDKYNDFLKAHGLQIELLYEATIAILYRPYVLSVTDPSMPDPGQQWKRKAIRRGREAASSTNNLLEQLIELDAVKWLKPMMITAMVPATQIHLADCKSDSSLIRGLGRNKLQLCMLVYADLRSTYWSADVMYRLFQRAQTLVGCGTAPARSTTPEGELEQATQQLVHESQQANALMMQQTSALPAAADPTALFVAGPSPQFSDVEQLLSPGFALSEDVFLGFFADYPAGYYGQPSSMPNYY